MIATSGYRTSVDGNFVATDSAVNEYRRHCVQQLCCVVCSDAVDNHTLSQPRDAALGNDLLRASRPTEELGP